MRIRGVLSCSPHNTLPALDDGRGVHVIVATYWIAQNKKSLGPSAYNMTVLGVATALPASTP